MTNKERLAYLIQKNGSRIGNNWLCNVNSSILFTFDDGRKWNVKYLDMDKNDDIYVVFHEDAKKYCIGIDLSEDEELMLNFVIGG